MVKPVVVYWVKDVFLGFSTPYSNDLDKDNFTRFPLSKAILDTMDVWDANAIIYESYVVQFQAYEITKLKWYQRDWFRHVTILAAMALTMVTGQLEGLAAAGAAAGAAGAASLALFVAETIAVQIVISATFEYITETFGSDVAIFIGIAAAIYGVTGMFTELPASALSFTAGTTGVTTSVQTDLENATEEYNNRMAIIQEEQKDLQEKIDTLNEQLYGETSSLQLNLGMYPNESPSSWLTRSLDVSTDKQTSMIHSYVDYALNLERII